MSLASALDALPEHLAERTRTLGTPTTAPRWVLYWMRTAVRAHENPALDVASELARRLGVPLFCYHALSERYPYASDRHHTFVLEGARDAEAQMADRGVGYAFHLERPEHRGPHLVTLARDAGVAVTEDMPVPPLRGWTETLTRRAEVPVVLVDTACVVPMRLTRRPDRAFSHRAATARLREARVHRAWTDAEAPAAPFVPDLPYAPVRLADADLAALVASCEIDHGVAPVPDTPGGTAAGHDRWARFVDERLDRYARDRNDPTRDGVSRMSAYLHYGFVSPLRLAREVAERRSKGAERFLDELVLWREIAYSFCFHEPRPGRLEALPRWARETLARHADDPRPTRLSWETLARGRTGEPLWDLAQASLLRHGELHNNVRMTWGKALLRWTRSPEEALALLIDLDHRYALDGRDPASYGGLLWCLGLFDRPFEPEAPIRGTLRPRPLEHHARRLRLPAYRARVLRPARDIGHVAVIGAGIAGLACARTLADHGVAVTVYDKGHRVGGRLSTRRGAGRQFDHGAQYVTARDPRFARFVRSWMDDGVMASWRFAERSGSEGSVELRTRPVGNGFNRALAEHLARDLDVRLATAVAPLDGGRAHALVDARGAALGEFDRVVVTAPLAQARALAAAHPALVERLAGARHAPCWALMVDFADRLDVGADALRGVGAVGWAAREASKPGRPDAETWVLHATPGWSEANLERDEDDVAERLLAALAEVLGPLPRTSFRAAHRWRHARVETPVGAPCLYDPDGGVAIAGDGLLGPRVEAAWLSGVAAAGRLLSQAR